MMKRLLMLTSTILLLIVSLSVTASASDYDAVAEDLSAIGMFRGTASGFELDRAPKRSEAAIMLVRLYGAEESAKAAYEAGEISHPFTDVSPTSSPAVAWLYTNGITNGLTETTFGSVQPCSAKMYTVFLLRALGYKDGVDFQYADALTFAQEKGFYDPIMFAGDFLRDDLAALTYQALAADLADGSTYLLDSLIENGAIDKKAAAPMTETIEAYRTMEDAMAEIDDSAMDMDIEMDMDIVLSADGFSIRQDTFSIGSLQMITDEEKNIQMAYTLETTLDGVTTETNMWMKDGWIYQSITSEGETIKIKQTVGDEMAALDSTGVVEPSAMNGSGLAMIESIDIARSGANTVYTTVIRENLGGAMAGASEITGDDSSGMEFSAMQAAYTVNQKGQLKKIELVFSASVEEEIPIDEMGTSLPVTMDYDYDMVMTINATGKAVRIRFPSFADYIEIPAE